MVTPLSLPSCPGLALALNPEELVLRYSEAFSHSSVSLPSLQMALVQLSLTVDVGGGRDLKGISTPVSSIFCNKQYILQNVR